MSPSWMSSHALPRNDDTLDLLAGVKYFSTLDLASGYQQVEIEPASQEKTAFAIYSHLFEFLRMPFGVVNAPATFQHLIQIVLVGVRRTAPRYVSGVLG